MEQAENSQRNNESLRIPDGPQFKITLQVLKDIINKYLFGKEEFEFKFLISEVFGGNDDEEED